MSDLIARLRRGAEVFKELGEAADEIERLRGIIHRAERELENVLVSVYKMTPEKINNPTLRELRAESQ